MLLQEKRYQCTEKWAIEKMYKDWQLPTGFKFTADSTPKAAPKPKPKPKKQLPKNHPDFFRKAGLMENSKKNFKEFRNDINEGIGISADIMAPAMLILKRRGIRVYPDGQRVALYHNDRFNMIFPVPFGPSRLNISNPSAPISGFTK